MEPLASSIMPILELYVAHTAQPIHTDTPVPSHAMLYTYTVAAYTQSSYQLATSVTLLRPVTYNHDLGAHALITTSWYSKMVEMYNIKLTEHLLYRIIICLFLSLYST